MTKVYQENNFQQRKWDDEGTERYNKDVEYLRGDTHLAGLKRWCREAESEGQKIKLGLCGDAASRCQSRVMPEEETLEEIKRYGKLSMQQKKETICRRNIETQISVERGTKYPKDPLQGLIDTQSDFP